MLYRITSSSNAAADGAEFEVPDQATEEEVAEAAAITFMEYSSYGWEPVDDRDAR